MSPNIAKILMNASGPFWTAKAEVIHFLNPGRGHWALRDLLVDTTPLTRLNRDNELLPGTRIALCSVQQVQISLGEESYVWNRSANQAPDDPSIEEIKTGLANGQLALLLVETDPESWPPNLSSAQPEFTCLAGEINLDAMKPVNKARERLYRALTLSAPPEVSSERAARLPGLLSVHSSGLSIYGQIKLPWQADKPIQAPFQLARLLPDPGATPGYRLTIESERLTPDEKQAVVTAWTNLSRFVNPDNPLTQAATGQPLQAPAWVTLEVANPEALPRLYWLASPWQATPQSLDLHFERGEINILLSDRSPYQEPTSLARATLDDVGIAEENNTLTITVQSGQSPTGEPQGKSSYTAKTNSKGWEEAYTFNGLELAFSPIEAAQFLRTSQALPTPSWVQGSGKAVNPPILWGFMPLEDGWAQLPVPNLSEQIYLDAKLDYSGEPVPQNALFQGAVAYGNADDITDSQEEAALSGLQPWSLTLTGAQRIKEGKWTLVQSSGAWKIASIQLEIEAPEIIANGFLWFSTGKPTIQDALPDLDNWVSGVQQLALHTVKPSDPFPAPVTLGMRSLEFIRRQTTSTGGDETARPQLGSWSFSYDLQSELFEALAAQQVLPKQPFSTGAPLVWLRHPNLPMIQALPITESKEPPNFPNASRQLVPFELPLPGSAETPASWLFGVTQAEGAAYWPTLTSQAAAAPEWSSTADLPLVSLSLPGLILDPKGTQASKGSTPESFLPLKYRFDLPYTDQVNALAQLPKTPKDPNLTPLPDQPPPEPARPLLRGDLGENWQRLDERASLASADGVESLDEIEAAGDPGQASLRHLVEPLNWPVRTKIDLGQYPGSLALDNDGSEGAAPIELSGQQALEGISGEFISQDGNQLRRLSESETPPGTAFKIVAGSMAAYRETDGSYRDQRGLRRGATLSTQGEAELNLLRTPVSMAGEALYELVSSREPLKLRTHPQASTGQDWQIWFRDLPLQKNLFERKHSRSPAVQEYLLDVNDPEATSRDYNYLNGYEWRLKGPAAGALQIYNLPFYPLALEVLGVKDDKPVRLEISGRLQLPLQDSGEQVDLSNTVRLTFQAETGTGILALSAVALEAIPGENGEEQPGRGEWPLATAGGEAADAPLLTWSGASLNADRSRLRIEGGKLNFYLFDTPWAVELQGPLEFPAELGQDPKIRLEIDLKPDGGQSLAAQSVHLEIDMNPAHAHTVSVDISAALSGRRGNLQALYTFEEGGGRTVHDISGVGTPLDLTADDSQGLNWGPDGLSILASRKIASSGPATKIIQAVQATRELSVELWVTPADSNQKGPARILTISGNDTERNLTIGQGAPSYQERTSYNARVRTSAITLGGSASSLLSRVKTTPTSLTYVVFTRDADGADRLFINGEEQDSGTVAGDFSNWDASYPLVLANETDGQLPWLGTYRLAAIYNRALSPFEVQEHFKRGASDLSWLLTQRGTFTATVTYQLLGAEGGKVSWKSGRLFDDLVIETTTDDPTTPSILANDTTLQFKWQHYSPDNPEYRLQLLPGMHLAEESTSPEGETRPADAPGFATLEFTPLPGGAVPELRLRSAFLEALITCHWGSFLQTSRTTGAPQPASPEQVFSSSAGNLALGYTTRWQAGHWEEAFLLNGCLEVKDLISWPKNMQFDPNTKQLTLPAIRPGEAPADLNHYRHSIRVLFNQHTIPAEALNTGKEQLLFNFADGWSWQFLAVVEHQLVEVSIPEGGEAIWLGSERRWTALQEVRMASPYAFKRFLTFLDGKRTTSPTKPTSEDLEDVNFSYLGSGLRNILASQGGALDGLAQEGRTLLVEASALHWIKQSPLDMPTATTLQFLPGGSQLGLLSSPQDYAPSDPADPRWLLLATPFLGRLQDQGDDGLEGAAPGTGSPLKVDPLWLIQQTISDGKPLPELALALTAWSETQEQVITFSAMDTAAARTWSRLDPIALEENWFRLQNPPREGGRDALGSVMASLPDTPARLSRPAALKAAFEASIQNYPPATKDGTEPAEPMPGDRLTWRQQSLLVAQGVSSLGSDSHPPYGWHLTGLQLLTSKLLGDTGGESLELVRYPAATVLPVRLKPGDRSEGIPLSLAVSPYLGLEFRPSGKNLKLRLVAAELLCTDQGSGELRPAASTTWERLEADEQAAANTTPESEAQKALLRAAVSWAQATHNQLCPDSPTAILRLREIRENIDPDERGEALLTTTYSFIIAAEARPPEKLSRRVFQVRSRMTGLRFREGQYAGEEMPEAVQAFELAPPQTNGVQPLYLNQRPASQSGQPAEWPWGLSALRLSVQYSEGNAGISGRARITEGQALSLWWQAPQFSLQYRAAQNGGGAPAAGLPRLFRAQAIKSLLPVVPGLPAPEIDMQSLRLEAGQNSDGSFDCWQPVLPGSLRYLIAGSRPGAMFAIRNMLLRQNAGSQNQSLLTSGSLPVQHRMPRPAALPPNRTGHPEIALQTWSSYFEPEHSLAAGEQPVDEAYLAGSGNQPPVRLRVQLTGLERNTVATNWDGTLKFQYQVGGSTLSDWEVQVELTDGRQTLRFAPEDAQTKESFKPTDGSSQDLLRILIAKAEPGSLLWVRMRASFTPAKDGFTQTLSYPLRVADVVSLPLPLAPRFTYFEDPEYNRRLASSSFHAEKLIKIPAGGKEQVTHKLTLACDRREYTPDGRVALRFDWDDDASDDSRGSASFEIQRIDTNGIPSGPLYLAGITDQPPRPGELKQFSLLDIQAPLGGSAVPFRAGEVLQVKLIVQPPAPSAAVPVVLAAKIISGPANPAPEAGYALLRSQKNGSGQVVECVRFAWSPDPARIELIAPEDLRTDLVRRRAVFQWSDTVRPDREVSYAVQKITPSGSTHFPELAVG